MKHFVLTVLACGLLLAGSLTALAAPVTVTFDLTSGSATTTATETGTGLGNSWTFTDTASGYSLRTYSWSDEGGASLAAAQGVQGADGMGTCNSQEDTSFTIFGFPITIPCALFAARRPADNAGEQDWTLIMMGDDTEWNEVSVSVQGGAGGDLTYWLGTIGSSDLGGASYADLESTLGFGPQVNATGAGAGYTIDLGGATGNALLIGGRLGDADDRITIASITAVVPTPASLWLLGSALGSLICIRRRNVSTNYRSPHMLGGKPA